ncbi:gamma-glutamyl-gamma-aminobutyrate hydrolase family protein [Magnetospira sp. QH-2]|uniref:gamma-glutamyl-gamma-aminobutyrate hydrolase family protein n=1 Tax=Magnetospira sp. (strain QH-2) TaxID=1288970 RepID=UPI0005FA2E7F|nr:gamma-glutamyl-gamma-aminobutyrate hydrolase family protein [Magnetospira sp. QH-2]
MNKPLIGITLDHEEAGGYSKFPWYALRENYCSAVSEAGGLPWPLAHAPDLAEEMLDHIQGLVVTGGAFDVDPALFGDHEQRHETVVTKDNRTTFEMAMVRGALERDMPILGICGGQQLLHVALGGRLIQHIPESVPGCLAHEQPNPRDEAGHEVKIVTGTRLFRIVGEMDIPVNSAHHQAAEDVPEGVTVNAYAPDGVIEGIEVADKSFCIGVQWHPEFHISPADGKLFEAFITAARAHGV